MNVEYWTQSYLSLPLHQWGWHAWNGFYNDLKNRLGTGELVYVENPAGNYLCFNYLINDEIYLHFIDGKILLSLLANRGLFDSLSEDDFRKVDAKGVIDMEATTLIVEDAVRKVQEYLKGYHGK